MFKEIMKKVQDLNLVVYLPEDREGSELDSVMWADEPGRCELSGQEECSDQQGIYFGTGDSREPKFCGRHYFTGLGYKIEPK